MTVRLVVTAFISLAVAAPVTYKITLGGDGEYAQTVRLGSDGWPGGDHQPEPGRRRGAGGAAGELRRGTDAGR